ncbi:hypothetical protein IAR55_006679 [Kwoniella newhampshirensis]|uniref:CENP-V/GFA domain-containing protein n=1 Tax=Kwoniella newhampshirensis TaxID=1651941 RepID=A0AAW0YUG8_9TREE
MSTISGSCNCGAIKVTIPRPQNSVLCHCTSCRKSGGTIYSTNLVTDPKDLNVEGAPSQYRATGFSGHDVVRNFCGKCGSPVFTTIADPSQVFVKAGLFEPGQIPKAAAELFSKNMEEWESVHEGAARVENQ